jgi:3-isopropylmalate/(R)-2-methylmalate dehydratase large subunit
LPTLSEAIFSHRVGREVVPGELIEVPVDVALGNDVTAPLAISVFREMGASRVWDPERVILVPDHFVPNKDIASAKQSAEMRDFAREQGLTNYFEVGRGGIEHALLPEKGLVLPGEIVVGADSHTCTYGALGAAATGVGSTDLAAAMATGRLWFKVPETIRVTVSGSFRPWASGKDLVLYLIGLIGVDGARYQALEYAGPGIAALTMDDRFTVANMAIEAGAKFGLFPVDEVTLDYVRPRAVRPFTAMSADPAAPCAREIAIDLSAIEPQIALPPLPEKAVPVTEAAGTPIDQVVIGSCTNGRMSDLRVAAGILKGRKVHPRVRCIVFPATQQIYLEAMREGLIETFVTAGCAVSTPTCGPCLGGHMGILAPGERAVATTNRNFTGRMGDPASFVYLASPATAAACAVAGEIIHPADVA